MYLVVSSSLKGTSRSRSLAAEVEKRLLGHTADVEVLDLSEVALPLCDGDKCYEDPSVHAVAAQVRRARGIVVATPIYNFDVNAAVKNLVELTGKAWCDTVVGFVCAAGGQGSYMSVMSFANSLMLDFRSLIIPRFVYATGESFRGPDLIDEELHERLDELASTLVRLGEVMGVEGE